MRVVLDTNVLLSGLMNPAGTLAKLIEAWADGRFTMVSSEEQITELRRASRYAQVRTRIEPADVGALINAIRAGALMIEAAPKVNLSPDPDDDYLLALSKASRADYLVSGDKNGLLSLAAIGRTQIVTAGVLLNKLG